MIEAFVFFLLFILGIALLIIGGKHLVTTSLKISSIFNLNETLLANSVMSLISLLPQVMIIIVGMNQNCQRLVIGNYFGSILIYICLILGLSLIFTPLKVIRKSNINRLLVMSSSLLILSILAILNILNIYIGIVFFLGFMVYFVLEFTSEKQKLILKGKIDSTEEVNNNKNFGDKKDKVLFWIDTILAILLIFAGAQLIVGSFKNLVFQNNFNPLLLGLFIVSLGTTFPQLLSTILSIKKKKINLALGSTLNTINVSILFLFSMILLMSGSYGVIILEKDLYLLIPMLLSMSTVLILPMLIYRRTFNWQGYILVISYIFYSIITILLK